MTEETKIPLPGEDDALKVPEFLKSKGWFDENIDDDFLNFEDPYKPPRYTLCRYGIPFANVGELHVISGKPGHGKTGLMSQLMAAILCGRFGNTLYHIQSERPKPVVLYIDTEQGKDDTIAIKNRVCLLAGLDYTQKQPQFQILRLRDTEDASERWKKILKAVWMVKPTDIFLDGMLDIVRDYNDQVECQPIIREAMMLATHYDSSLWIVLHENPMVDKLVGTLGSIVQRKVAEIFSVKKIKQSELKPNEKQPNRPSIYFTVKQLKARGRDVADWDYAYQQNADGVGETCRAYEKYGLGVVGTKEMSPEVVMRGSSLKLEPLDGETNIYKCTDLVEKVKRVEDLHSNYTILGRCVCPPEIFDILDHTRDLRRLILKASVMTWATSWAFFRRQSMWLFSTRKSAKALRLISKRLWISFEYIFLVKDG